MVLQSTGCDAPASDVVSTAAHQVPPKELHTTSAVVLTLPRRHNGAPEHTPLGARLLRSALCCHGRKFSFHGLSFALARRDAKKQTTCDLSLTLCLSRFLFFCISWSHMRWICQRSICVSSCAQCRFFRLSSTAYIFVIPCFCCLGSFAVRVS